MVKSRPTILSLVHVRLPPGHTPSWSTGPKIGVTVHQSLCRQGTLFLSAKEDDQMDYLWMIDSDMFPFQNCLIESRVIIPVNGRTWALSERENTWNRAHLGGLLPPKVVTQHADLQREFVMVTAQGTYSFVKLKPVDQLRHVLENGKEEEISAFFQLHKVHMYVSLMI